MTPYVGRMCRSCHTVWWPASAPRVCPQCQSVECVDLVTQPPDPAVLREAREEAIRKVLEHLRWIRGFAIAHHAQERSGVHLHHLTIDIPQYLDDAIAELEAALDRAPQVPSDDSAERERRIATMKQQGAEAEARILHAEGKRGVVSPASPLEHSVLAHKYNDLAECPACRKATGFTDDEYRAVARLAAAQTAKLATAEAEVAAASQRIAELEASREMLDARLRGWSDFFSGQPRELPYRGGTGQAKESQLNVAWALGYDTASESELWTLMVGRADRNAARADAAEATVAALEAQLARQGWQRPLRPTGSR